MTIKTRLATLVILAVVLVIFSNGIYRLKEAEQIKSSPSSASCLDFENIVGDILWIQSIQQFSGMMGRHYKDLNPKDWDRVYASFDRVTDLMPRFTQAYKMGGLLLSCGSSTNAIMMFEKGMRNLSNPGWEIPAFAGIVAYQGGLGEKSDYIAAEKYLRSATRYEGCPSYVARLLASCIEKKEDLGTSLDAWEELLVKTTDPKEKQIVTRRLKNIADQINESAVANAELKARAKAILEE